MFHRVNHRLVLACGRACRTAGGINHIRLDVRTPRSTLNEKLTMQKILMTEITAIEARSNFYRLIAETADYRQPIVILVKRNKAVLASEEDSSAMSSLSSA